MTIKPNEIDWTQNCLTQGVHNGRQGSLWSIPLGYAVIIFKADTLRQLVIERIHSDARQIVECNDRYTLEWADAVKHYAELMYQNTVQHKVGELSNYYKLASFQEDIQGAVERVRNDKLNPFYEPLHHHDTINLLCRIIGVRASAQAS